MLNGTKTIMYASIEIKVSVIIPVFNAEKYLEECVESLLNQSLKEIEFIFVNDGSIDKSLHIIESYQKKDNRISIINQHNQGVSVARNQGITQAIGDYLGFVDADDTVESDYFEKLYNTALFWNADIVISHFIKEQEGVLLKKKLHFPVDKLLNIKFIQKRILPYMIAQDGLNTTCTKIYRRELIISHHIKFPEGVALGEDGLFNFLCFSNALNAVYIDYSGYFYREVHGSATRDIIKKDYFKRALEVYNFDYKLLSDIILPDEDIQKLKSIRLANKVLANVFIYMKPSNGLTFWKRYVYVRNMILHPTVRSVLANYWGELYPRKSRFQNIILFSIKYKLIIFLIILTSYSYNKNK